ncbi:hypothetical protein MBLNU457_7119t1 [Dothideomycetes sp. NU457]
MTDLLHVVPDLDLSQYSHILPSLEKALISSTDLLTLDVLDIAKRAHVPLAEVRRLADDVLRELHAQLHAQRSPVADETSGTASHDGAHESNKHGSFVRISTLDPGLDLALGGGFCAGRLSEVTGESAAGKTQLLLSLCLAVQLPPPHGLSKSALYITTEASLQTTRLAQILNDNTLISQYDEDSRPSLDQIQSTKVGDLEAQEHIIQYQVPVAVERGNVGLIVLDSVAANFRAEFDRGSGDGKKKSAEAFAERSRQLTRLGALLREIAETHNVAVVVANQVQDRFAAVANLQEHASQPASQALSHRSDSGNSKAASTQSRDRDRAAPQNDIAFAIQVAEGEEGLPALSTFDPLSFDHQQRFFTGWGDQPSVFPFSHAYHATHPKTPSLGLPWTNQLSARVVLLKEPIYKAQDYLLGPGSDIAGWKRTMKVAFGQSAADDNGAEGTEFEISSGGIRALDNGTKGENGTTGKAETEGHV